MASRRPTKLSEVLGEFRLRELIGVDLVVAIAAGVGGWWVVGTNVDRAVLLGVTAALVGMVVGAVIAGVAIVGAFLSPPFLRKLRALDREPTYYLAPFLFTATVGVLAMFGLIAMAAIDVAATDDVFERVLGAFTGFTVGWTIASLIPDLDMLVQFIRLQDSAAHVDDDVVKLPKRAANGDQ